MAGRFRNRLARSLYALLPQPGGQTHLRVAEEMKNAIDLSEKGFSITQETLKAPARTIALNSRPDAEATKQ